MNRVVMGLMAVIAAFATVRSAKADFIPLPAAGSQYQFTPLATGATMSYDAVTQIFTATESESFAARILHGFADTTGVVHDISETFSLTATIDGSGNVHGGSFTLTGSSPSLGIATVTTLLTGNIVGGGEGTMLGNLFLDFLTGGVSVNPNLQSVVGPIDSAVIEFAGLGCRTGCVPGGFSTSFGPLSTPLDSPIIWLVGSVPEPGSLPLVLAGLLGFALVPYRRYGLPRLPV